MRLGLLTFLSTLVSVALADVQFTKPAAGASLTGGSTISIAWKESGTSPAISTFLSYQLFLMAGGNTATNSIQLAVLVASGNFAQGNTATAAISVGLGAATKNAYYLKMISVSQEGGTVINYSDHFTLAGMTGTFPAAVISGVTGLTSTAGPESEDNVSNGGAAAPAAGAEMYTVPYHLQTGLTKYAPMQPIPPTKITAKSYTPLNPSTSINIATTYLPVASMATTLTMSQTFSVSSVENTAAAASNPTGDMAKFLARWKD